MKILYITTSTALGGAEQALAELVLATARQHTVRVVCLRSAGEIATRLREQGIEVICLNLQKTKPFGILAKLVNEITSFRPDVVHAQLYWGIELARLACAGRGLRLVTTPHFDFSKRPFGLRLLDFALKGIDSLTVAESLSTANYLIKHQKYRKDKVYFLPNGADKNKFFKDSALRSSMRERYGFSAKDVVFISVARLAEVKSPLLLAQSFYNALRLCPQIRLVYVGDGPQKPFLEQFIAQNRLSKHILLAGKQDNINAWLNMADVFVLPSQEESLPLALLEALHAGLPCIVSNVGDMPLWVKHGENGFVLPKGDITLLTCFISELAADVSRREAWGVASLEKAALQQPGAAQYQTIYEQICSGSFHMKTPVNTK